MTKETALGSTDLGVVACKHVANGLRAIALATRYDDGDWSFSCGQTDHSKETEENNDFVLVHVDHVLRAIHPLTKFLISPEAGPQSGKV